MTQRESVSKAMPQSAKEAAGEAARHPWLKRLARIGLGSVGLVYMLVGLLALRIAIGPGSGQAPDQQTALQQIQGAPLGVALLALIALGLLGYAVWRVAEAFADLGGEGSDARGLARRAGHALSGVIYGGLGLQAGAMAIGVGGAGGDQQEWTARLMGLPLGRWLVGIAGACVIGYGAYQIYEAWTRKYRERLNYGRMSQAERRWIDRASVVGLVAHGVVLGLVGLFLIQAARTYNPEAAQGLSGALNELSTQPFGPWLLGATAAGLVAYGIAKLIEARSLG